MKEGRAATPLYRKPDFESWFKNVLDRACGTLERLYIRYSVHPGIPLDTLALHQVYDQLISDEVRAKLRSIKMREEDERVVDQSAKILNEYMPILMQRTLPGVLGFSSLYAALQKKGERPNIWLPAKYETGELAEMVKEIARRIPELGPSLAHRPRLEKVKQCAIGLIGIFKDQTGQPLNGYVGDLLHAAWPEWNPKGDISIAVLNLIQERRDRQTREKPRNAWGDKEGLDEKAIQRFADYLKKAAKDVEAQMEVNTLTKKIPGRWKAISIWIQQRKRGIEPEEIWKPLPREVKNLFRNPPKE